MTKEQKIIRAKVGLLELARQLGNVSQACKMMGTVLNFVCGLGTMGREELSHGPTQGSQDPGCYS